MKVVNKRKELWNIYIGRGSIFGNPFVIGKDGTREEVIDQYKNYLSRPESVELRDKIYELPCYAILGCYCKPKACHGDLIVKLWEEMHHEK